MEMATEHIIKGQKHNMKISQICIRHSKAINRSQYFPKLVSQAVRLVFTNKS